MSYIAIDNLGDKYKNAEKSAFDNFFDNFLGKVKNYDEKPHKKVKKSILRQSCVNKMQFH